MAHGLFRGCDCDRHHQGEVRGSTASTAPQNTRDPFATRSRMVFVINSSNASLEWLLGKIFFGGDGSS